MDTARNKDKMTERNQMKDKINSTRSERVIDRYRRKYQELDKEVKRMAKRDKKDYVENLVEEAEEAAGRQDLKMLYTLSKTLRGGYSSGNMPVKDVNGRVLSGVDDNLKRWQEHFHSILNRPEPENTASIPDATRDIDIETEPPSIQEIKKAIKEMKNGKAPEADGICAELLKAEESLTPTILLKIFHEIWISENMPEDWKAGLIVRLAKKGDLSDCNNWRGITLLSLTSKVFIKIIQGRMTAALEKDIH